MGFKEIGRKIQIAREERGMTQVDLAHALGITQAALSNYELGKRRLYLHQIERIASVLGKGLLPCRYLEEATGLGAAMAAAIGVGLYASLAEAAQLVETTSLWEPDAHLAARYAKIYPRWCELYPALRRFFTGFEP